MNSFSFRPCLAIDVLRWPAGRKVLTAVLLCALCAVSRAADPVDDVAGLIRKYCVECHRSPDPRGELDLATVLQGPHDEFFAVWEDVADRLRHREMPPADAVQPAEAERRAVLDWYSTSYVPSLKPRPGSMRPRRLSAVEYRNTMRSLFGFDLEVSVIEAEQTVSEKSLVLKLLPTEPPGRSGFRNDTHTAPLTTVLWEQYSYLADAAIAEMFSSDRRPELLERLRVSDEADVESDDAEAFLQEFVQRAFRRSLTSEQMAPFVQLAGESAPLSEMQIAMKRILMAPQFLYRGFLSDHSRPGPQRVDAWELAERLSYFLWADMPDAELFEVAATGELADFNELRRQINRMVDSPSSITLATDFAHQWLTLGEVEKNNVEIPQAEALRSQPRDFMHDLFVSDRPLTELIDSRTAFVNPFTRGYYGDDARQMTKYRKAAGIEVEIVPNQKIVLEQTAERGGILTMPGILAMNQGPIIRGVWILERILGEELPEPPPNVGQVPPPAAGETLTFRERFEQHRSNSTCAVCHDRIDPIGFSLQRYEGARYAAESTADTSGRLPSGETFADFQELKRILVTSQRRRVIRNIVNQTLSYAISRRPAAGDQAAIEQITDQLTNNAGTYRELLFQVASSMPFQQTDIPEVAPISEEGDQ